MDPIPQLPPYALPAMVLVAAALAPLFIHRAIERRDRVRRRETLAALHVALRTFLDGEGSARTLRQRARECDPETFWQALELVSLDRRERRRLGHLFERSAPAARERRALRGEDPARREVAAWRLGQLDSRATRRALRRAVTHAEEPVAAASLLSLARAGDPSALRFVLDHPRTVAKRTPRYRFALLRAFGPRALPLLHDAVECETLDPALARAAIETLGAGGYRTAAPSLVRRLRDPEPDVRVAAARALGSVGALENTMSLRRSLEDPHWAVRAQAARALGRLRAHHCEDALTACLTDTSWWVRRHAAYALAEMGQPGQTALEDVAEHSPDRYARDMAREVLDGGFLSEETA